MGFEHGVNAGTPVTADDARHVARVMSALATSSRVRILGRLREGSCAVGELAVAVEMEQPAVSHQLRILRDLGLVVGSRRGRQVIYGLYDSHVATLLDEALRHIEHLRAGSADAAPHRDTTTTTTTTTEGADMTDEHTHDTPHAHEHDHDGESHVHAHTEHDHEHVEHEHEHEHDGETHAHTHPHETGLEDVHEHEHA